MAIADFVCEIGCEEMPSAPLMNAQKQLGTLIERGLADAGLVHGELTTLSTPRRLAVMVKDCATRTEAIHEELRGPASHIAFDEVGNPSKAALGFAKKNGVAPESLIRRVDSDGREYVFCERSIESRDALELLAELCRSTIAALEWPNYRSQRWGSEHESFVRPIRWICSLLGSEQISFSYADVTSGNTTRGHRVLSPGEFELHDASAYVELLNSIHVAGEQQRIERIRAGIAQIERERAGAHVDTPQRIFDEVVNLCEWPQVLVGSFDEEFLAVPHEIICESMLSHQRYFPIYDASGELTREFVIVSNADPEVSTTVIDGNERVVRARLDDAKFFYDEDLKVPLDDFVERLSEVTFQVKAGTMRQKVARMEELAKLVAVQAGATAPEAAQALRAAHLAKGDLVSQAVVEFTNQQGVMGGYYAEAAGEDEQVVRAIREHYRPRFAGDETPSGLIGKAVAIADKLDTVCTIFAIGEPPSGSSDPYAVRRASLGVIAMLRELEGCSLPDLIECALANLKAQNIAFDHDEVFKQVSDFFAARLAALARDEGIAPDTVSALTATGVIDPSEFLSRAHALDDARKSSPELFDDLATAYARASHLADASLGTEVDQSLLGVAEKDLYQSCVLGSDEVTAALEHGAYADALSALARLREPIDRFFEEVLVMDEDTQVRSNRLRLLNLFASVFEGVADIGALAK